ncbi:AIR synthase-related protein [Salegentibacter salegens]|uniref:Hydrogenase maturation factor n=1 Tax=Salegentibacter salegens TaxID=143223 RepID=A0A1M7KYB0_9FLAO|nr:AIR synthase-related protein [Salegentibacter salegens]PRX41973.1 hydrogenase maturation factor [Salegentibacter salegens]SHM70552.1 Hydrogenase maturation factor [Salegentibacter salegens]
MSEKLGKIAEAELEGFILKNFGQARKEVSVKPGFGVDVSLVDLPNELALIATSDPLSLIPSLGLEESAWLSVHLMANDMATTGFPPQYAQMVLNLPASLSREDFKTYWNYIHQFSKDIGVAITGGHTGFVEGQNSTISGGGTFFSVAPKKEIVLSNGAEANDVILVTKTSALSSSALLTMSFPETIKNRLGKQTYEAGCEMFKQTSSLKDGLIAAETEHKFSEIHAMHDVTEGGVLGAIYEMVKASGKGALIYDEALPIISWQKEVCELFKLDYREIIGAGSMIISCEKGKEQQVISRIKAENIACAAVGEIKNEEAGIKIAKGDEIKDLEYKTEDPYWKAFFTAIKSGWK